MRKPDTFLENATIRHKSDVTRKFTLARDDFTDFHLGAILLRSARSFLDGTAFLRVNELRDAVTRNPQTA